MPSPAMIVAPITLFVTLGGTGYAVVRPGKNSVGTKQLKNRAVIAKKIKNRNVTRLKIGRRARAKRRLSTKPDRSC
jgi:hypothetical protein